MGELVEGHGAKSEHLSFLNTTLDVRVLSRLGGREVAWSDVTWEGSIWLLSLPQSGPSGLFPFKKDPSFSIRVSSESFLFAMTGAF
jgi:hypothetical protein